MHVYMHACKYVRAYACMHVLVCLLCCPPTSEKQKAREAPMYARAPHVYTHVSADMREGVYTAMRDVYTNTLEARMYAHVRTDAWAGVRAALYLGVQVRVHVCMYGCVLRCASTCACMHVWVYNGCVLRCGGSGSAGRGWRACWPITPRRT